MDNRCTVKPEMAQHPMRTGGDCRRSNVMHLEYNCYRFSDSNTLYLPNSTLTASRRIDVLSPHYPCRVPPNYISIACQIASSSIEELEMVIKLFGETGDDESVGDCLKWNRKGSYGSVCKHETDTLIQSYHEWNLTYTQTSNRWGRPFWIQITGDDNITVSCTFNARKVDFTTDPTGCEPFRFIPLPYMRGTPKDSSAPVGVIVGLLCLVVVAVVIVFIVCYFRKRCRSKKTGHQRESYLALQTTSASQEPIAIYCLAEDTKVTNNNTKKIKNADSDNDDMYTAIDENKKVKKDRNKNYETVMVENDLYETGDARSNVGTEKPATTARSDNEMYSVVNNDKKGDRLNHDADETIMQENDELYEAAPADHHGNADTARDQTRDEVIEYEDNDLYSPQGDQKSLNP